MKSRIIIILIGIVAAILFFAAKMPQSSPPQQQLPEHTPQPHDNIRVRQPVSGASVSGSFPVLGEARGTWFFEASFPIRLLDSSGVEVATAIATAEGQWMTTEFVPFSATMDIPHGLEGQATLVFEKDNPSGLPEHDDELRIPIDIPSAGQHTES